MAGDETAFGVEGDTELGTEPNASGTGLGTEAPGANELLEPVIPLLDFQLELLDTL